MAAWPVRPSRPPAGQSDRHWTQGHLGDGAGRQCDVEHDCR